MNQFGAVIETLEQTIAAIHPSAYPALLGEIERMKGLLWQRLLFEKGVDTPRDAEEAKLLTIPQAAKLMAIPSGRAYELARQGKLPSVRIGKYVRVRQPDLLRWIQGQP